MRRAASLAAALAGLAGLAALLAAAAAAAAAVDSPVGSSLDHFRYQPSKIRVDEVAH